MWRRDDVSKLDYDDNEGEVGDVFRMVDIVSLVVDFQVEYFMR